MIKLARIRRAAQLPLQQLKMNQRSAYLQSQLLRQLDGLLESLQRAKLSINILQVEIPVDVSHTRMHS